MAAGGLQGTVVPQLIVVVGDFVAQHQTEDALSQQRRQPMIATGLAAQVAQRPGQRIDPTPLNPPKLQYILVTLCHGEVAPVFVLSS